MFTNSNAGDMRGLFCSFRIVCLYNAHELSKTTRQRTMFRFLVVCCRCVLRLLQHPPTTTTTTPARLHHTTRFFFSFIFFPFKFLFIFYFIFLFHPRPAERPCTAPSSRLPPARCAPWCCFLFLPSFKKRRNQ